MKLRVAIFSLAWLYALLLGGCGSAEQEEDLKPVVDVKAAVAEQADFPVRVQAPATVFPREQASIAARLTAPIRDLPARKGDVVSVGQLLAQLDDSDLQAQRTEAAAAVNDAEASLAKTSGSTLPTDIERARGDVATTQAALDLAQKNYDRRKQLYDQGAIPNRDLLATETELSQAKTNAQVAQRVLGLLEGQSREQDLQMGRSKLEQARARLGYIDAQLAFTRVTSPFAGVITDQLLFPGDMAKPDTPIFTIANLSIAVARAQVPEADAHAIRKGQHCDLTPADTPDANLQGQVTVVNEAVDPDRRTVEVWCEIPNGNRGLRAGVFGNVTIVTGTLSNTVVVPVEAVQFEEGTRKGTVVVADSEHKAKHVEVEAGPTVGGKVPILSGVNKGDTVIVSGGYGLEDGTEVRWEGAAK